MPDEFIDFEFVWHSYSLMLVIRAKYTLSAKADRAKSICAKIVLLTIKYQECSQNLSPGYVFRYNDS